MRLSLRSLACSASFATLAMPALAHAQDPTQPAPTGDVAASAEAAPSEDIVVTGSRIARPEYAFPNPVQSFTAESIEQSGNTNLTDFLLDNIAVRPDRQGRGYGRQLLNFAEAEAIRQGWNAITLYTHVLMVENIAIYTARGYAKRERRLRPKTETHTAGEQDSL